MSTTNAVEVVIRRERSVVALAVVGVSVVAWWALAFGHAQIGAVGSSWPFAAAFAMWMIMMVAMMLPPVLPWVLLFASTRRDRDAGQPFGQTTVFVSGYFTIWLGFCVAAAGLQRMSYELAVMPAGADRVDGRLAGALFLAAGVFQLTPLKAACLRHCRSPLGYFVSRWRDGQIGAFRMGATHGLFCLGCCWALMLLSFAVGVMNLLWMAILTVVLCVEKIAPGGDRLGRAVGALAIAWGLGLWLQA